MVIIHIVQGKTKRKTENVKMHQLEIVWSSCGKVMKLKFVLFRDIHEDHEDRVLVLRSPGKETVHICDCPVNEEEMRRIPPLTVTLLDHHGGLLPLCLAPR